MLIAACGAFSLLGFPLDDVWHRLFGQDVTLWGPTHLMLIGGAAMTLVGLAVLMVEAGEANREAGSARSVGGLDARISLPGAMLLGLSTVQAEFDFGVPQFRMVFHPMLIMLAAGVSLVAARVWLGRGSALGAALFFLAMRGLMALLVGPILGEPTPHFPLYLVEALLVELIALRVKAPCASRCWRELPSARSGWRPSGAGRTCGWSCRGRPRCSPKAPCSAWRPRSPPRAWAAGSGLGCAAIVSPRCDRPRWSPPPPSSRWWASRSW